MLMFLKRCPRTEAVNQGGDRSACSSSAGFKYQTAAKITLAAAASVGAGFWMGVCCSPHHHSAPHPSLPRRGSKRGLTALSHLGPHL